jgi:hypothetical protein
MRVDRSAPPQRAKDVLAKVPRRPTLIAGAVVLAAIWIATRPRLPMTYALATVDPRNSCLGIGSGALVLHGRVENEVVTTWANDHLHVYWPSGYSARFEPDLIVIDRTGAVRGREGDDMAATYPWHDLYVCNQSSGFVDVWELTPAGS